MNHDAKGDDLTKDQNKTHECISYVVEFHGIGVCGDPGSDDNQFCVCVKAQGPLRCDLHKVVVTSNNDWSVFDNVKDLRGIYGGEGSRTVE